MTTANPSRLALLALSLFALTTEAETPGAPATRPVTDTIPGAVTRLDMIRIPGGSFSLKDKDGTEHVYTILPFLMQRTELRWEDWDTFYYALDVPDDTHHVRDRRARDRRDAALGPSPRPYHPPDGNFGHDGWPAANLTLHSVHAYIDWLNRATGRRYRLPTEVEWEWACRAGSPNPVRPTGKDLDRVAWHAGNSGEKPHKVATKAPNAWGLYDMLGNVAERVLREDESITLAGGSFEDPPAAVNSDAREYPDPRLLQRNQPDTPRQYRIWLSDGAHVGFRLVREPDGAEDK